MNKKKITFGIILIFCSLGLAVMAFYFLEVKPELAQREVTEEQSIDLKEAAVKPQEKITIDYTDGKSEIIPIVADEAVKEKIKEPVVKKKSSGFLWVDRKSSKYVVTLGKKNGLVIGSQLTVFQDDNKLGKVEVEALYDTIAYVRLIDISTSLSENDYYKVIFD